MNKCDHWVPTVQALLCHPFNRSGYWDKPCQSLSQLDLLNLTHVNEHPVFNLTSNVHGMWLCHAPTLSRLPETIHHYSGEQCQCPSATWAAPLTHGCTSVVTEFDFAHTNQNYFNFLGFFVFFPNTGPRYPRVCAVTTLTTAANVFNVLQKHTNSTQKNTSFFISSEELTFKIAKFEVMKNCHLKSYKLLTLSDKCSGVESTIFPFRKILNFK